MNGVLFNVIAYLQKSGYAATDAIRIYGIANLMSLPVQDALVLIAISVLLTVVAGLLPARSASKKDPVEALRSE